MLKEPKFVYTVDMDVNNLLILEPRSRDFISDLEPKVGLIEHIVKEKVSNDVISIVHDLKSNHEVVKESGFNGHSGPYMRLPSSKPKIAVVGSGPSGLFAALVLAEFGADVTLIERGQPVEQRGRDIGALVARRILELDSNFCFGEVINFAYFITISTVLFGYKLCMYGSHYCFIRISCFQPMLFSPKQKENELYDSQ